MRNYLRRGFEPEIELLKYFCNRYSVSVDIGANYGIYSYKMAELSNFVYSFEPVPYLYGNLCRAFKKSKNVQIHNIGLSNSKQAGILYSPEFTHGWSTLEKDKKLFDNLSRTDKIIEYKINLRTLDSFNLKNVSFIKIDVEGHENNVLEGSVNTIKSNQPVLQIEIEERHRKNAVNDVIEFIKAIDLYETFVYHNSKLLKLDGISLENYQNMHNTYFFNFIFIHIDSSAIKYLREDNIL